MEQIIQYLRDNRDKHLDWVKEVCRIPSISTKSAHAGDVRRALEWTRERCKEIGLHAELCETGGHPLVYAECCPHENAPTYLVYGHMDVQPEGDLGLWDAGPFEPVIQDGKLVCRGAADDKGQVVLHLRAAAAWIATHGQPPVNLKFLIEGEEEIASPNLRGFLEQARERLTCRQILISDTGMFADGYPTITEGTRGLLYKEIRLHGPKHDLHSGSYGGSVANPANVLARIIAALHNDAGKVTIPGFYDDVLELTDDERRRLGALPFDEDAYANDLGVPGVTGEAGYSTNERRWIRPTLDVNGIYGGFMAEGANTIIPSGAGAKISMRLVPNQNGQKLSTQFDEAIKALCPPQVRLEIIDHGHADAYVAATDSPAMQAAERALREAFDHDVARIREGGSLPILPMFRELLGADSLLLGFAGPNCNAHGPNENIVLADMDRGAEAVARLYGYLADMGGD